MSNPFLGEIRAFSFPYAPRGWAQCNGQTLPIAQNQALFSLMGTTYGGNGQTTFQLPNLQGRVALHRSASHPQGLAAGEAAHTLTVAELPQHTHLMRGKAAAADAGAASLPVTNNSLAQAYAVQAGGAQAEIKRYSQAAPDLALSPSAISAVGGSEPHENRQPFTTLLLAVALEGIFPSRN